MKKKREVIKLSELELISTQEGFDYKKGDDYLAYVDKVDLEYHTEKGYESGKCIYKRHSDDKYFSIEHQEWATQNYFEDSVLTEVFPKSKTITTYE